MSSVDMSLTKKDFDFWDHIARIINRNRKLFMDTTGQAHLEAEPWEPLCEIIDEGDYYVARFEVPGMDKRTLSLTLENNKTLCLHGTKMRPGEPELGVSPTPEEEQQMKRRKIIYTDIVYGFWSRKIDLPGDVDAENISAKAENGVLTIVLPKIEVTTTTTIKID